MKFTVINNENNITINKYVDELVRYFINKGNQLSDNLNEINFVLNITSIQNPKLFRRRSKSIIVITITADSNDYANLKAACYSSLIKSLSNQFIYIYTGKSKPFFKCGQTFFTTPEAGFYYIQFDPQKLYELISPIANSHFATDNLVYDDLPKRYYSGSAVVEELKVYGKEMDKMGVLPAPFPLKEILGEFELRHLYKIFGITGASYGNLSAREVIPELGENTFWMTGRGIDKSNISEIGKDVLLVKDFNFNSGTAIISSPKNFNKKARVSVDAVEHSLIYKTFPEVKAIVHVHAWMENILCTQQNYPCGTKELAEEVVSLLKKVPDKSSATVGLKNHGLTITGKSLKEIFDRIQGKLITEVKMVA